MTSATDEVRYLRALFARMELENNQLRMQVEDLRQAHLSPYSVGDGSHQRTWREVGEQQLAQNTEVTMGRIEPALCILQQSRTDIEMLEGTIAYTDTVARIYNDLLQMEALLEPQQGDEEEDEDEYEDEYEDESDMSTTEPVNALEGDDTDTEWEDL